MTADVEDWCLWKTMLCHMSPITPTASPNRQSIHPLDHARSRRKSHRLLQIEPLKLTGSGSQIHQAAVQVHAQHRLASRCADTAVRAFRPVSLDLLSVPSQVLDQVESSLCSWPLANEVELAEVVLERYHRSVVPSLVL